MHIEEIIASNYGKDKNVRMSVSFNKLVRTGEYESERIQADLELDITPDENVLLELAKAQALLEYECMTQLLFKRQISQNDYNLRKAELEQALDALEKKVEQLTQPAADTSC